MTSPGDRRTLIVIARQSIDAGLNNSRLSIEALAASGAVLPDDSGGAFVTLKIKGKLRGCVGRVICDDLITQTVADMAYAAAFSDPRFPPLTREELDYTEVEISRISPPFPIELEQVKIGVHGLMLSVHGKSGLLLPQVPLEENWNLHAYLDGLCHKTGVPPGSHLDETAVLEAFTAEVFEERNS